MWKAATHAGRRGLVSATLLLVLAGCAASQADATADGARVVDIEIDGYHFVPDHFTVNEGETVRFKVSNPDRIGHELYLGTVAEQAARRQAQPPSPEDAGAVTHFGYGIYLPAFADGEFEYTFSSDTDLLIGCHLPGHWEAGMVATIDVVP